MFESQLLHHILVTPPHPEKKDTPNLNALPHPSFLVINKLCPLVLD